MRILLFILLLTLTSFNMGTKFVIYQKSSTVNAVVYAYDMEGNVLLTNDDSKAMQFTTIAEANAVIELLQPVDFFGARPTRPHK
jgi:hypothetical protein